MLESTLKEQLKGIFAGLNANYTFDISISPAYESRQELLDLLGDVASCSDKISMQVSDGEGLEFILLKDGAKTGIKFRGVPNGHEFTSLLLAILNSDGKGKNFPDESICNRVKALNGPIHLTTYVSLTCTNCPDVVQALNAMTTLNPQIHHEMVDGAINQAEVDALKIQGVPSVFADGKLIHVGRGEFGELLSKLEAQYGINESLTEKTVKRYDVVVVGGGPAGASAAIYSARKGLSVAVVAERIGGQVKETVGIENLISVPETTGTQLADNLRLHMRQYPIDLLEHRRIEKVTIEGNEKVLSTAGGEIFKAPLTTYVSLTCTNCPDVVQALNAMTTLNPQIHHEMVDGAINQAEVDALKIQGVPSVFADGKLIHVGRGEFGELLSKLEAQYGINESLTEKTVKRYDVVVVGGGPAGASAAIYSARKGLSVAVVAERIGGQVKETVGIENLISVPETTGTQLADNLRLHMRQYPIDLLEHRRIEKVTIEGNEKVLSTAGGEIFKAPAVIVATGASWRKLNVPGEAEYIGRGVAFCPHCDGPFYKGKHVAVVGGGNSGIEAAIDLAVICSKVTVLEFMDELKADQVLQEKAKSLPNVEIFVSSQTTEVVGNGDKVTGIRTKDRKTGEERVIHLDGIFVQIGLAANSGVFKEIVETNRPGEIVIDAHCRTNVPGIYAAGDVSTVPFKQIIISMGEGAKAALSAFEDRVRGVLD